MKFLLIIQVIYARYKVRLVEFEKERRQNQNVTNLQRAFLGFMSRKGPTINMRYKVDGANGIFLWLNLVGEQVRVRARDKIRLFLTSMRIPPGSRFYVNEFVMRIRQIQSNWKSHMVWRRRVRDELVKMWEKELLYFYDVSNE
jgi:hypothetical protein